MIPEKNGGLGLDLLFATAVSQSLGEGVATLPFLGPYIVAPTAIKYGASDNQKEKLYSKMSQNLMNFGIGFSEYFGSRDSSGLNISDKKVTNLTNISNIKFNRIDEILINKFISNLKNLNA